MARRKYAVEELIEVAKILTAVDAATKDNEYVFVRKVALQDLGGGTLGSYGSIEWDEFANGFVFIPRKETK